MGARLGLDAKLYWNDGNYGSPDWQEMDNVKDLTLNLETAEADVTTRGNNGWRATLATLKDGTVEFQSVDDPDDVNLEAFFEAWLNKTQIECLVLNGPVETAGSRGWRITFMVTKFSTEQPLENAQMVSISLKPTYADHAPERYVVPGT